MKLRNPVLAIAIVISLSSICLFSTVFGYAGNARQNQAAAGDDLTAKLAKMEKEIEAKRKETGVPGLSVAIVKDDKLIFAKGFGQRDVEHNLPVTPDTLFAIGSATKAFTAMATAISVDQGKFSFDDSPHKYLPYFKLQDPDANSKVQLRDMLSHKTGLANYTDLPWVVGVLNRQEVIEVVGDAKPTAPFRSKFQYNNVMFSAAGEAVAAAQKSTYEDVIRDLIFKPLGMSSSDLSVKSMQKSPDFSRGYAYDKDTKKARLLPTRDITDIAPAGAINSSANDMSKWVRLMLGGGEFEGNRLVSEKSFHELVSTQTPIAPGVSYGFGWVLASWRNHKTVWHNGGIDGFHSLVDMIPDEHLGFVILSNEQGSQLEGPFADIIFSNLVGESKKAGEDAKSTGGMGSGSPLSDTAVKELIGSYKSPAITVKIAPADGKVSLVVPGQPAYPLVEKSKDSLASTALPDSYEVTVKRDASGKVSGITIKQPQVTLELARESDYTAPITVDELLAKAIEAGGGRAAKEKHRSQTLTGDIDLINQGVKGHITISDRAPYLSSTEITFEALGKKIGWVRDYFDGATGASETSFSPIERMSASKVADAKVEHQFHNLLDAKNSFKEIKITGVEKVDGEEAYVTVMTPKSGNAITEYFSTASFKLLRRDVVHEEEGRPLTMSEYYSDYKDVDGEMVPFKIVQDMPAGGKLVISVKEVKFNSDIPESAFKAR